MGLHYVNGTLVNQGTLDPTKPQIVIYEATPNGGQRLIGAELLVLADAWDKKNQGPPELIGHFSITSDFPIALVCRRSIRCMCVFRTIGETRRPKDDFAPKLRKAYLSG